MKIFLLAIAGASGTLVRYFLGGYAQRVLGGTFPWGTFTVNMVGCFLFGLVWAVAENKMIVGEQARTIALAGFMGAFTTFSSYMFETSMLVRDSNWALAIGNVALENVLGFVFVIAGMSLGRMMAY